MSCGGERGLHRVARQRRALVDEAGDAPGRRHVDEHRAAVGEQRVEPRLREGLVAGRRRRSAARQRARRGRAPGRRQRRRRRPATRRAVPSRERAGPIAPADCAALNDQAASADQHEARSRRGEQTGRPDLLAPAPRPARRPWRRSGRPAPACSVSIQAPGRGRRPISCGARVSTRNGSARPRPSARNTASASAGRLRERKAEGRRP